MNFEISLGSSSKAMTDIQKEGRAEIQKIEYLENENSFLNEIKSIFHCF